MHQGPASGRSPRTNAGHRDGTPGLGVGANRARSAGGGGRVSQPRLHAAGDLVNDTVELGFAHGSNGYSACAGLATTDCRGLVP